MARFERRGVGRFALLFLVWTVVGLFFFTQDLSRKLYWHDPTPWWRLLLTWLAGVWVQALMTPAILALGRRFPIERRGWPARSALHLLFSVSFAAVALAAVSALYPRMGFLGGLASTTFLETLPVVAVLAFHGNIVSYWVTVGVQHALRTYRRYQDREKQALRLELHASELTAQLARAQLSALKVQLQPHFLFNTLNAITVLVRQQRGLQAEETLARLGDLLRFVLDDASAQEVPLRRELQYVELYLSIEQLRFEDRLRIQVDAEPEALDAAVPHMGLQPLVENAVRHGIGQSLEPGRIQVRAARVDRSLVIRVMNDGPPLPALSPAAGRGIGLANTRARLQQLHGDRASLTLANREGGGVVATMILPHRVSEAAEAEPPLIRHAAHRAHRR